MRKKDRVNAIEREAVVYTGANGVKINALADVDTIWLNRQQLAVLFGCDVKTIGKHVANALKEELKGFPVVAKFATTAAEKLIKYVVNTLMPPVTKREPIGFHP